MKTLLLNVAWAVLVLAVSAAPLAAADIQGKVSTSAGRVIDQPALVRLMSGENAVQEEFTDFSGRFRFRQVVAGPYIIRVECEGYRPQEIPITMSKSTYQVSITLQAVQAPSGFTDTYDPFAEMNVPPRAEKEFELGIRELEKVGGCEKALPHFQKAVALYPKYGDAIYTIGGCYQKMGNLKGAEESYKEAMASNRKIDAVISLADLYFSQQRFEEGRNLIIPLLPQHPTEGDLYAALARNYFAVGQIHDAELAALNAQSRSHKSADVHLLLAKIYEGEHNRPALITQLKAYLDESGSGKTAEAVKKQLRDLTGEP